MSVFIGSSVPVIVNLDIYRALDKAGLFSSGGGVTADAPEDISLQPFETNDIEGQGAVLTVTFRPVGGAVRLASFVVGIDHELKTVHVYSYRLDSPPVYQVGRAFGANKPSTRAELLDKELHSLLLDSH